MNSLDSVTADLEFDLFIGADLAFLDQPMSGHDHEEFPLAVVPVLPFGDAGLCDVHGDLTAVLRFQQFCEAASLVYIHLHRECDFFRRQVGKIGAVELLLKAAFRNLREQQCLRLVVKGLE